MLNSMAVGQRPGLPDQKTLRALKARFIGDMRQAVGLRLIQIASDPGRCPGLV